jgi:hypothetical protein
MYMIIFISALICVLEECNSLLSFICMKFHKSFCVPYPSGNMDGYVYFLNIRNMRSSQCGIPWPG